MIGMVAFLGVALSPWQAPQGADSASADRPTARAVLAAEAPVIDGRDDDALWQGTASITDFQEWYADRGQGGAILHRGADRLRPGEPLRLRPLLRSPPRQHHPADRAP